MAHQNKVMHSYNSPLGDVCVDIFERPDMSFGFEEYRRDHEDGRGWFPIGNYSNLVFSSKEDALETAVENVCWLKDIIS